jgi:ribonuclease HII
MAEAKPRGRRPAPTRRTPDYGLERAAGASPTHLVAGVDEVGRGALAGPVVAAAVVLPPRRLPRELRAWLRDSKLLTAHRRRLLATQLPACAEIGVGQASAAEIDRLGVVAATLQAMSAAVRALPRPPQVALIDGPVVPPLPCEARAVVKGDRLSLSVAAASIVAKVARDRIMQELARHYPGYGWERNCGYGTPAHLEALVRLGPAPPHRRSFAPVRALLAAAPAGHPAQRGKHGS